MTVLVAAHRLQVLDAFAARDALEDRALFVVQLGGKDLQQRLADRLLLYTAEGDALLQKVRDLVAEPGSVWLRGATLEDVFLNLTGRGLLE